MFYSLYCYYQGAETASDKEDDEAKTGDKMLDFDLDA